MVSLVGDDGERKFALLNEKTYVYSYSLDEQKAASSISIAQWDAFSTIRVVQTDIPPTGCTVDLLPFFLDNKEICERRGHDPLLDRVLQGKSSKCWGKYTYSVDHIGILWREDIWLSRLYYCLSEKEEEWNVQIVDLSNKGPSWKEVIPTVLHAPVFSFQVAPFKGVTDLLILSDRGAVVVAVADLETEIDVQSGSLEKPKLVKCDKAREMLPNKLGELLSSMYLIASVTNIKHPSQTHVEIYGWLLMRSMFSIGVPRTSSIFSRSASTSSRKLPGGQSIWPAFGEN